MSECQDMGNSIGRRPTEEVPVVCIVYNRARLVRKLIDRLRQIKPSLVLVVADGPKCGDTADTTACAQVRAEISRIDWACTLHLEYAESNMGCSKRVVSGLNWAFSLVDRAIILEDDIDADPRFFDWAARMLVAYEQRDDVAMLCGHNPLVWWPNVTPNTAGIVSRRGGVHGWATWRSKWRAIQNFPINELSVETDYDVIGHDFEPSLAALLGFYLEGAKSGLSLEWDINWTLRMALSGRCAIVSPVNLVHNLGLGPDATHHKEGDDMLFFLPRGSVPSTFSLESLLFPSKQILLQEKSYDQTYDRARVLLELMVRARDPATARRLAQCHVIPLPSDFRLHLLPFRKIDEMQHWIEHLANAGVDERAIERWRIALGSASHLHPTGVSD